MSVPHILADESSAYYHAYVLAEMSVHQTRAHFKRKYGALVDNDKVSVNCTTAELQHITQCIPLVGKPCMTLGMPEVLSSMFVRVDITLHCCSAIYDLASQHMSTNLLMHNTATSMLCQSNERHRACTVW